MTRISYLDIVRGLLTLQDPKQFLFFTRTPNGRRAGKEFLAGLKERTDDRDKAISIGSYRAQLKAIHRWGHRSPPTSRSSTSPCSSPTVRATGWCHQELGRPGSATPEQPTRRSTPTPATAASSSSTRSSSKHELLAFLLRPLPERTDHEGST